jgi:chaperonin GroES
MLLFTRESRRRVVLMANVKPLADRILLRRLEAEEVVRGGIIIPDTAQEKPLEAVVVAVGDGRRNDEGERLPLEVGVGDRVLISKYGGSDVKIDGVDHVIMREDDVLAVLGK